MRILMSLTLAAVLGFPAMSDAACSRIGHRAAERREARREKRSARPCVSAILPAVGVLAGRVGACVGGVCR